MSIERDIIPNGSAWQYSLYPHAGGFWQLWRGRPFGTPTFLIRQISDRAVKMCDERGLIQRVGLTSSLLLTLPTSEVRRARSASISTDGFPTVNFRTD